MPEFHLDTSGKAYRSISETSMEAVRWADLDAFTQGYVEALFASGIRSESGAATRIHGGRWRFSDLAPETLAAILKDCGAYQAFKTVGSFGGGDFWRQRQNGQRADFPPLTAHLGDDGKVHLS